MTELPTDSASTDADDVTASVPQVSPKEKEHPHLEWMRNEIHEEVKRQTSNKSEGNMSDSPISKDWVERKASEIESKIEINQVKNDARFEKLISGSDIKFEKLMGEMNTKLAQSESTHTKWMVGVAFSLIAFTMATIGVATNLILKAIPASQQQGYQPGNLSQLQGDTQGDTKQQADNLAPSSPPLTKQKPHNKAP